MKPLFSLDFYEWIFLAGAVLIISLAIYLWTRVYLFYRKNKFVDIYEMANPVVENGDHSMEMESTEEIMIVEMNGMDGRGGFGVGSADQVSSFKKKVLLGYRENGQEIITECTCCSRLEYYLVRTEVRSWQKFLAKIFRLNVCIGTFRPKGEKTGYMKYYLYWHSMCKNFVIAYVHGKRALPCNFCNLV